MADSVSASPRSASLGAIADALMRLKGWLGTESSIPDPRMDPHLGALRPQTPTVPLGALFGQGPEEIDRWSYGNSPFKTRFPGVSGRLPELQDSRKVPVLDAVALLPLGTAAKGVSGAAPIGALFGAMKPKGGVFLPKTVDSLASALAVGANRNRGDFVLRQEELTRMARNWLNRHAGTSEDPLRDIPVPHEWREGMRGEDVINELVPLEQLTDKAFTEADPRTILSDPKAFGVENARQGDRFYYAVPGPEADSFLDYLGHVGDTLRDVPTPDLKRWDLIRAVRETARRDAERAKKLGTVEGSLEGTAPIKSYPDSGYQWVEVQTASALKNEGDVMGHCVGGYCADVEDGSVRIISLRDPKGQAHVTIELSPSPNASPRAFYRADPLAPVFENNPPPTRSTVAGKNGLEPELEAHYQRRMTRWLEEVKASPEYRNWAWTVPGQQVNQIKGKQNLAPKAEYVPMIQDFLRTHPWSHVFDLENARMWEMKGKLYDENELRALGRREIGPTANSMAPNELRMRLEQRNFGMKE